MKSIKLRRRVIVCGAIIILLYCYFTPKYFFNPNDISVHHIEFSGEAIHTFDEAKVKIILSKIQGQRTFRNIDPYIGIIEINCLWKNKPLHIVLGNTNFCYQSASDIQHIVILNGPEIMQEIMETLIK